MAGLEGKIRMQKDAVEVGGVWVDIKHRYEERCVPRRWIRLYACWLPKYLLAAAQSANITA